MSFIEPYRGPGTRLWVPHALPYLSITATLGDRFYSPCFSDEATESHQGQVICSRLHNQ